MVFPNVLTGVVSSAFRAGKNKAVPNLNGALIAASRSFSTAAADVDLKSVLASKIPHEQERLKSLKKAHGAKPLGQVTVDMCIGGMRGIPGLLWETSLLDPEEGIRFRGYSIPELQVRPVVPVPMHYQLIPEAPCRQCSRGLSWKPSSFVKPVHSGIFGSDEVQLRTNATAHSLANGCNAMQAALPGAKEGGEPLPEGLLWLLLTGEIPNAKQVASVSADLKARSKIPEHVYALLDALPPGTHPMTQFGMLIMALQPESQFAKAYEAGIHKSKLWEPFYEDTLNLLAKLPALAAMIYRKTYKGGKYIDADPNLDWAANLSHMMGYDEEGAKELMRLYQTIHSDHEGGNVSAHATHLVGSALSDPYLSFAAGMCGLAGPLHGLANQEVLRWIFGVVDKLGNNPSKEQLTEFVWDTLKSGKVVPGYGHAVLRKTDPRYTCQREFALKHLPDYPLFKLCSDLYDVVPAVLTQTGKVKNPWPNVDAHSGVLLQYYDITEENFYTVLFGVSRAIGVLAQGVWSRALGLPIERPKSLTMEALEAKFNEPAAAKM